MRWWGSCIMFLYCGWKSFRHARILQFSSLSS